MNIYQVNTRQRFPDSIFLYFTLQFDIILFTSSCVKALPELICFRMFDIYMNYWLCLSLTRETYD
jgi:hypothetical protein